MPLRCIAVVASLLLAGLGPASAASTNQKNGSGGMTEGAPSSGDAPVANVKIGDLVGRWCGDQTDYTFSRTEMVVTPLGNRQLTHTPHWGIDKVTAQGNRIQVFWKPAKPGNSTAFEFGRDRRTLIQLPQTEGDKGPRRVFHRC